MKTLLKWPGGKEKELPVIKKNIPQYNGRYVEPFVGGGAVFFDTYNSKSCINDKSWDLINFYLNIKNRNETFKNTLYQINNAMTALSNFVDINYDELLKVYLREETIDTFITTKEVFFNNLVSKSSKVFKKEISRNLNSKITRSANLEKKKGYIPEKDRIENMESALKSSYYMYIRYLYNHPELLTDSEKASVFFFIREYCYSSMFRYNKKGNFNVPYGGISYNRKDLRKKIDYIFSDEVYKKLNDADIKCEDFEDFFRHIRLTRDDFVFLDPPYDTDFSTYDQNEFGRNEQIRLRDCLNETQAKFLLIIKNTDFIYDLYKDNFRIQSFDKKYRVSFMNRNAKDAEHLIITNY